MNYLNHFFIRFLILVPVVFSSNLGLSNFRDSGFTELAEKTKDSIVSVYTIQKVKEKSHLPEEWSFRFKGFGDLFERFSRQFEEGFEKQDKEASFLGSGIIYDSQKGLVLTNHHVIENAAEITVEFSNGVRVKADLVGKDSKTDIAVLRVDSESNNLKEIQFADSDKVRIGALVIAIGSPFGFTTSITSGIISGIGRDISNSSFGEFIQTDASLNKGMSGGALINMEGEMIGMNTAIVSSSGSNAGVGFAIPTNIIKMIVEKLVVSGKVDRGYIGVRVQPVTSEIAQYYGYSQSHGALVVDVVKGGPADKAGIEHGDLIIECNNTPIDNIKTLLKIVAFSDRSLPAQVKVKKKNGKIMSLEVDIKLSKEKSEDENSSDPEGEDPKQIQQEDRSTIPGFVLQSVESIDEMKRRNMAIRVNKGVFIAGVTDDETGVAKDNKGSLRVGCIISEASGNRSGPSKISNLKDIQKKAKEEKKKGGNTLLLLITHPSDTFAFYSAVKIDE